MDDLLREIVKRYDSDGRVLRETEDGRKVLQSVVATTRAVVSSLSAPEKKRLALARGVPDEGAEVAGAWQSGDENRVLVVPLSDETPDRHGTILLADGWDFRAHDANPVYLAGHNADNLPIGLVLRRTRGRIQGPDGKVRRGFNAHTLYSRADLNPQAETYYRNRVAGRLKMTSVGFVPKTWRKITRKESEAWEVDKDFMVLEANELLELSDVTVGSNPSMVGRDFAVACVRAFASTSGDRPVLGRDELSALYGKDVVEAAGVELPERSAELGWDALLEAADQIEKAIEKPVEVRTVEVKVESETEETSPKDRPIEEEVRKLTSLIKQAIEEGDSSEPEVRTIDVDGESFVSVAALEQARAQQAAIEAAAELIQLATQSGDQPDPEKRTEAFKELLGAALEPIQEAIRGLSTEVQALANRQPAASKEEGLQNDEGSYGSLLDLADEVSATLEGATGGTTSA